MNIPYVFHNLCSSRSVDIGYGSSYPQAQVPPLSPTVLKLTNQYHPNAKSYLEYLNDRHSPIYSSVFT